MGEARACRFSFKQKNRRPGEGARTAVRSHGLAAGASRCGRNAWECVEHFAAAFLAASAGFGAYSAVFVHVSVLLALLAACFHRLCQCFHLGTHEIPVGLRLAREDASGGVAHVGAVEVRADAVAQICYHVLGEAGVGTGRTGLSALEARFDTLLKSARVDVEAAGVGGDHLLDFHGWVGKLKKSVGPRVEAGAGPVKTPGGVKGVTVRRSQAFRARRGSGIHSSYPRRHTLRTAPRASIRCREDPQGAPGSLRASLASCV